MNQFSESRLTTKLFWFISLYYSNTQIVLKTKLIYICKKGVVLMYRQFDDL